MKKYIVTETRLGSGKVYYVAARPGFYRAANGEQLRDNLTSSAEWTDNRDHALEFKSHRAAAIVANKTISGTIKPI